MGCGLKLGSLKGRVRGFGSRAGCFWVLVPVHRGSIVVPVHIWNPLRQSQKGTSMEP